MLYTQFPSFLFQFSLGLFCQILSAVKAVGNVFLGGVNENSAPRVGENGSETVREWGREAVGVIHSFILFCSSNQQNYKW